MRAPLRQNPKLGAAVIELAVCLPLLVLIAMATVEACSMIYLKQSLKVAAYEGARVGVVDSATAGNVTAQCDLILTGRDVQQFTITLNPADPAAVPPGDFFRVTCSAPCVPNSLIGGWFYQGLEFSEFVEIMAE